MILRIVMWCKNTTTGFFFIILDEI